MKIIYWFLCLDLGPVIQLNVEKFNFMRCIVFHLEFHMRFYWNTKLPWILHQFTIIGMNVLVLLVMVQW